jgi:hypothetical protein
VASLEVAQIFSSFCGGSTGSDGEIGGRRWLMWRWRWSRRGSEGRGCWWCEDLREGRPPFIAAGRGRGAAVRSSMATRLQGRGMLGNDAGGLVVAVRSRRA